MLKKCIMFSLLSLSIIICWCKSDINSDNTNSNDTNNNPQQIELWYESADQGGSMWLDNVNNIPVADDEINDNHTWAKDLWAVDSLWEI
jgi:hypothetical protein